MENGALEDSDLMPFGAHKGKTMEQVPADYLLYIAKQDWIYQWPTVVGYLKNTRKAIDLDLKDMDIDERLPDLK